MLRAAVITSTILGFAAGVPLAVPFPALAQGPAAGGVPEGTVLKSCAYISQPLQINGLYQRP